MDRSDFVVTTDWLSQHLDAPDIVVIDASWHLPASGRDGKLEFAEEHIPGALFFDIDALSDETSPLPHMLPSAAKFSSRMRQMGIGDGMRVIAYDSVGLFSAARAWWMFKVFGHDDVAVLDGGLMKWKAEGHPLSDRTPGQRQPRHFTARTQTTMVRDAQDVLNALKTNATQIADARSPARFSGAEREPRAGLRSGHMPTARNVHYTQLLNADGTLRQADAIRASFEAAGIDLKKPVITTCGSGVTAAILSLGLGLIGHSRNSLYDGSWSEWGGDETLPVETGDG